MSQLISRAVFFFCMGANEEACKKEDGNTVLQRTATLNCFLPRPNRYYGNISIRQSFLTKLAENEKVSDERLLGVGRRLSNKKVNYFRKNGKTLKQLDAKI